MSHRAPAMLGQLERKLARPNCPARGRHEGGLLLDRPRCWVASLPLRHLGSSNRKKQQ